MAFGESSAGEQAGPAGEAEEGLGGGPDRSRVRAGDVFERAVGAREAGEVVEGGRAGGGADAGAEAAQAESEEGEPGALGVRFAAGKRREAAGRRLGGANEGGGAAGGGDAAGAGKGPGDEAGGVDVGGDAGAVAEATAGGLDAQEPGDRPGGTVGSENFEGDRRQGGGVYVASERPVVTKPAEPAGEESGGGGVEIATTAVSIPVSAGAAGQALDAAAGGPRIGTPPPRRQCQRRPGGAGTFGVTMQEVDRADGEAACIGGLCGADRGGLRRAPRGRRLARLIPPAASPSVPLSGTPGWAPNSGP